MKILPDNNFNFYSKNSYKPYVMGGFNIIAGESNIPPVPVTYEEAIAAVGTPQLWYKHQGTSGTLAANSGSLGSGWNATFATSQYTLGHAGQIGANEAIAVGSSIEGEYINNYAATPAKVFSKITFARLMYLPVTGQLYGSYVGIGSTGSSKSESVDQANSTMKFDVGATGGFSRLTTDTTIPRGEWVWVFGRWDGTTGASDIRLGYAGSLVTPTYSSSTQVGTGTFTATYIEYEQNVNGAKFDEVLVWDTVATDEQLLAIVNLSGLNNSMSYNGFVASKVKPIWYKLNAPSGTSVVNYGHASGWAATISTSFMTPGVTGKLGASEALEIIQEGDYLYDGSGTAIPLTTLTFARLMYVPTGAMNYTSTNAFGAGSSNRMYLELLEDAEAGKVRFQIRVGGLESQLYTSSTFPRDEWFWLFARWDGATGVISVRWTSAGSIITPALSSSVVAAIGTFSPTSIYNSLEKVGAKWDEEIIFAQLLSDADLLLISQLSGVIP